MTSAAQILGPACIKTLSAVEARPERSNQHEFNGVQQLKRMFGSVGFERQAIFSIRGAEPQEIVNVTWYDARENHPTRTEYRLYFQTNTVMSRAQEGDNILIGFDASNNLHFILIKSNTAGFRANINNWEILTNA